MTLVELLVVLAILALMTTVAVTSSDVFMSQGRYEATTRTLTDIQEAVLGPPNARQADGTLISLGFVADVGRSPDSTSSDPTLALSELWAQPSGVAPFSLIQSANDTDVVVPCGWRGPYLRLGVGQTSIRDGWGNAAEPVQRPRRGLGGPGRSDPVRRQHGAAAAPAAPTTRPWPSISRRPRSPSAEMCTCWIPMETPPTRPARFRSGCTVPTRAPAGSGRLNAPRSRPPTAWSAIAFRRGFTRPVSCGVPGQQSSRGDREEPHRAVSTERCNEP